LNDPGHGAYATARVIVFGDDKYMTQNTRKIVMAITYD